MVGAAGAVLGRGTGDCGFVEPAELAQRRAAGETFGFGR
jgi:hypothetical protein